MVFDLDWLRQRMEAPTEDEHLEFKAAKTEYRFDDLAKYCAALANEGGGQMILGVTDRCPRQVVGTNAFPNLGKVKEGLLAHLRLRVEAAELQHPQGRVLIFDVPFLFKGQLVTYQRVYWMRSGESLIEMSPDRLRRLLVEDVPDFSAQVCPEATPNDLDPAAIEEFRSRWLKKAQSVRLSSLSGEQLLRDVGLLVQDGTTYAALVLCGLPDALDRLMAQAEVVFEYRADESSGPAQERVAYRRGFFAFHEDLWTRINRRNDRQSFEDGLFKMDILTFNEEVVREAILNAVSHRDYRQGCSIFVRQYPRRLEVASPGGFPAGVTVENILDRQDPRNRRIADALEKCGLVERSGQGVNIMFEKCIQESKPRPDFSGTDDYQVKLMLRGEIQDPRFLKFMERVGRERQRSFTTQDFLLVDTIFRGEKVPALLQARIAALENLGIVEQVGRGRGRRVILSRQFHEFLGSPGRYTRAKGLDRDEKRMLLLKHITDFPGCSFRDFPEVLPALSREQIRTLLQELTAKGQAHHTKRTKASRWYPGPAPQQNETGESE